MLGSAWPIILKFLRVSWKKNLERSANIDRFWAPSPYIFNMKDPNDRLIATLTLRELEELMVKAVKTALANSPPPRCSTRWMKLRLYWMWPLRGLLKCRKGWCGWSSTGPSLLFTSENIDKFLVSTVRSKRLEEMCWRNPKMRSDELKQRPKR